MTAFLSIQVALLFLFIAAVHVNWHDLPMNSTDNPKADHPVSVRGANREDAMIVAVQRNGDVWLGYEKVVNIDELTLRIRDGLRRGAERKGYINADRRAKYGQIRQVLRAISLAGIENWLVYQREPDKTTSELLDDSRPKMNQRSNAS